MLQALLHKKLKASFVDPSFKPSEDTLTSSVLGLMQYLPSPILLSLLKGACGINSSFPVVDDDVLDIHFWDHWNGQNTTNSRLVEPDVLIVTDKFNIIIEVKKSDEGGQYLQQWRNELIAFQNTHKNDNRRLLALGGNSTLKEQFINLGDEKVGVYKASWFNLLHSVSSELAYQELPYVKRLLLDIINAFEIHGFFEIEWMNTLSKCYFNKFTVPLFSNIGSFGRFYNPTKPLSNKYLKIWQN